MFLNLFNALIRKKQRVIAIFYFLWFILAICFVFALRSRLFFNQTDYIFWSQFALLCGKTALIFFAITLSPGIFNRFGIRNRNLGIIMIFRRQFGISMFLLAAFHGLTLRLVDAFLEGPPFKILLFEWFGIFSVSLLFFLFITSNDFSQARLGKWWYLLHRLVYIIMWFILIHLALQRVSLWTILASVLVIAEMSGIIYSNLKKKLVH